MKLKESVLRMLTPAEGYVLTQSKDVGLLERSFSPKIYLAPNDSPDSWKEIPRAEADALLEQQRKLLEEERAKQEKEAKRLELERQLKALENE